MRTGCAFDERRRRLLLGGLAGALLAGVPARAFAREEPAPADPTPPPAWRFEEADWFDPQRGRELPVRLYLPAQADLRGLPLLLFSHGIGGSRRGYSYLGQHLAAQGFACLHVQHVGSDRRLWSGSPLQLAARLKTAARPEEARARVLDLRLALARLLLERPELVDAARIAVAGHSYGATTSLLLAGVAIPDEPLALAEPRLRAAVFISAPPLHGVAEPDKALAALRLPALHITATADEIWVPGYHSSAAERIALFEASGSPIKRLAVFEGGSHSVFTDRRGTGGWVANPRIKGATQQLVAAFLQGVLAETGLAPLDAVAQRHRGLLARWA